MNGWLAVGVKFITIPTVIRSKGMNMRRLIKMAALLGCLTMGTVRFIGAEVPRPEHPRSDMFRENWATLNGTWQFEIDAKNDGEARGLISGKDLAARIIVPFCPESALSGVGNTNFMTHVWYRTLFELPDAMRGKRVRLHFGAVDYQAWVYVNGQLAGTHVGGSAAFTFEVSKLLRPGRNELVVRVFDDTRSGLQPTGKQTHSVSEGCVYTRTTGIWQPVWLEAVGSSFIEQFSVVPDPELGRVVIALDIDGTDPGLTVTAEALANGKRVGSQTRPASWRGQPLVLNLSKKILWEPGTPFLYDLKFTLKRGKEVVDTVQSYFGLRRVSIEGRAILINGKRVFQRLILDQGFYPDGIWTAPSDAALRRDIELSMAAGYNGARLHQKVFEPRFLYWADKLGYLVWGEFPSWGYNNQPQGYAPYMNEWVELLRRDRNHPSVVGWCPFNETGNEAGEIQQMVFNVTKAVDPTRPALETSGYTHTVPRSEVRDDHDYNQNPDTFRQRWLDFFNGAAIPLPARYAGGARATSRTDQGVPFMVSEFGGTFWGKESGWGYGQGPKNLDEFYQRYEGLVTAQLDNPNLFGFCYTQLTDVEQEHNGLYFYDRTPKFDAKRLHAITSRPAAYEKTGPTAPPPSRQEKTWTVLSGAAADGPLCAPFHYTTATPSPNWFEAAFDDSAWPTAMPPFGNALPGVKTPWKTDDIYLRRAFDWNGGAFTEAALAIFYDEDTTVYVNGQKIFARQGYLTGYEMFSVTDALKKALRPGRNTLAVHTHQTGGGNSLI